MRTAEELEELRLTNEYMVVRLWVMTSTLKEFYSKAAEGGYTKEQADIILGPLAYEIPELNLS